MSFSDRDKLQVTHAGLDLRKHAKIIAQGEKMHRELLSCDVKFFVFFLYGGQLNTKDQKQDSATTTVLNSFYVSSVS